MIGQPPRFRIVFMGTPEYSVPSLEFLASHHEIVAVYAQPDKPAGRGLAVQPCAVKKRALELGIPVRTPVKASAPEEVDYLQSLHLDFLVVIAYGQILRKPVLEAGKYPPLNLHASLLPRWRGAAPIQRSILNGDAETGVCVMQMVEKLDAGDVFLEKRIPIMEKDSAATLFEKLSKLSAQAIIEALPGIASGKTIGVPQDEAWVTQASKLTKQMEWLNPHAASARKLDWQIRAFTPWPGSRVKLSNGETLKILEAEVSKDPIEPGIGQLSGLYGRKLTLGSSNGTALILIKVQQDGKKPVSGEDFARTLNGQSLNVVKP